MTHEPPRTHWRQIPGPELSPRSFRAATVPDGPNGWSDGEYERIEAKNRQLLAQHFTRLAAAPSVVELQGSPPASDPDVRARVAATRPDLAIPDDLSIPDFLKRGPAKS